MNCPICSMNKMNPIDIEGIKILHCAECDGIFLHHGELKKITHKMSGDVEYSSIEAADFTKKSGISCPLCDEGEVFEHRSKCTDANCKECMQNEMIDIYFASFSDVKMQYCPKCRGIWLNKGTLKLINDEIDKLNHDKDNWEYILGLFLAKLPF